MAVIRGRQQQRTCCSRSCWRPQIWQSRSPGVSPRPLARLNCAVRVRVHRKRLCLTNLSVARQVLTCPCITSLAHAAESAARARSSSRRVRAAGMKSVSTRGQPASTLVLLGAEECVTVSICPPLMLNHKRTSMRHFGLRTRTTRAWRSHKPFGRRTGVLGCPLQGTHSSRRPSS